jgi:putative zinc finger/helix-turn-helix YgiT family protein
MSTDEINGKVAGSPRCPECDSLNIVTTNEEEFVPYGMGNEAVEIRCIVPVRKCQDCHNAYTDEQAANIRHEAVCRHLKLMTPAEILAIRKRYGLSRNDFAKLTRIGEASLARWENGYLFQNPANDQLLFLLQHEDNIARLLEKRALDSKDNIFDPEQVKSSKVFRALKPADVEKRLPAARKFALRPAA